MGQEITHRHFKKNDFEIFRNKINSELQWVSNWFKQKEQSLSQNNLSQKSHHPLSIGFELESCFIDQNAQPACINDEFIQRLKDSPFSPQITKELAQFNIELNSSVFTINRHILRDLEDELNKLWSECETIANNMGCSQIMIGSLPSLQEQHLKLDNMSQMTRYKALNEQVLRSRKGRAIELDIQGAETLKSVHQDVMLESTATSFQLHF
ncbi:MAG: glutamate--cysteine ligase, partial [Gammaproteobacteria bacterium]